MNRVIIGADTETLHGEPITYQFYSRDNDILTHIHFVKGNNYFEQFFNIVTSWPSNYTYVVYIHNLEFDFVSFFYDKQDILYQEEFIFEYKGWKISGVFSDTKFLIMTKRNRHTTIYLIDTYAFFQTSLAKLADMFCPDLPKLTKPDGLGQKRFGPSDHHFIDYAMRDAEIAYYVGKFIDSLHDKFDIQQSFTLPHMASRIFRHKFLERPIPLPSKKIVYASLHSYHGGKNLITVEPGMYYNVKCLDIVSAYPYAMTQLPSFSVPEAYRVLKAKRVTKPLPEYGIYRVEGYVKQCIYPSLFTHNFKPLHGETDGVWVTGFELNEAIRSEEIRIDRVYGYVYDVDRDPYPSPLKRYVDYFFEKKHNAENKVYRYFYKIAMNSLYGKFIQSLKKKHTAGYDCDSESLFEEFILHAGGLFHPFIATLITGHTRAYIHRLEHKYNAIHTSTDGIMTQSEVDKSELGDKLGAYNIEAEGNLLLFRNKLYILYNHNGEKIKWALHGFHADVNTLERMYHNGIYEYEYTKVNKLRESIRRGLKANDFIKVKAKVNNINFEKMKGG